MKKNMFDLDKQELKQLMKEFKKTPYYKQYLYEFVSALIVFSLFSGFIIGWASTCDCTKSYIVEMFTAIGFILTIGIIAVIAVNFAIKRLDILKYYYETKHNKEK